MVPGRLLLLLACVTTIGAASLTAQGDLPVRAGDEIKIRSDGAIGRFTVIEARQDALLLQGRRDDTTRFIPLDGIRKLSVSRGPYTRSQGAGRGLLRGAAIGLVLGGLAAPTPGCGGCSVEGHFGTYTVEGAMAGAAFGGFVGTIVGMLAPGTRWEAIPVKTYHVRPGASGRGFELGVGLRF